MPVSPPIPSARDAVVASRLRVTANVCGAAAALIGGSALWGWIVGDEMLMGFFAAGITVKANTAIALLLTGLSLILLVPETAGTWRRRLGQALAILAIAVGLATLSEHLFGWNLGIDEALFREGAGALATQSPNRMGPPASVCFPLLGTALLLLDRRRRNVAPSQVLALAAVAIAVLPILGYVFGVHELYGLARYTGIALHTAVAFTLLGLAILFARPGVGLVARIVADDAGGLLMRRMLPAALLLPLVLGWLRVVGQEAGLYDLEFGRSLLVYSFMIVFTVLTWWIGGVVNRHGALVAAVRAEATASERRFREIADSAPELIWHGGPDGASTFFNRRYREFFGLDWDALDHEQRVALIHPDDRQRIAEEFRKGLATRHAFLLELRQRRHDGVYRWMRFQVAPVVDAAGTLTGWTGSGLDVDDERGIAGRNQALYRLVAALARAMTPRAVADAVLREVAPSFGASTGMLAVMDDARRELVTVVMVGQSDEVGQEFARFGVDAPIPLADAVRTRGPVVLASRQERDRRYPNLAHKGSPGSDAWIALPLLLEERALGAVGFGFAGTHPFAPADLAFFKAVADHCAQALDRLAIYQEAQSSAERYRTLADATPALVAVADGEGRPMFVNSEWVEYTGVTLEQLRDAGWAAFAHPEEIEALRELCGAAAQRREPFEAEFRFRRQDGVHRWFLGRTVPLIDDEGRAQWLGVAFNITERKAAEDALRHADRRKDEFLATLAHELRNPLAPIRHATEILKLKGGEQSEARWARDVIDRQLEHMTQLLDDLLDVSRITRNRLELRKHRVSVAHVVQRSLETSRPGIEGLGHRVVVHLPEQEIWLDADPLRVSQVISNLLNNAAKYTDRGGHLELRVTREGSDVLFAVKDDGIGIAPAHLPNVFDIFAQVAPALERSQGGLGIGLSLVRGIVQAHGGSVEASSAGLGHGSEFVVRLPAAPASEPATARATATEIPLAAGGALRIVLADDHADVVESLAMVLRLAGHDVHVAHDGAEAVEVAERVRPDAVLLDIGMPRLNGYEAARRIRTLPWGKNVRLAALTGWGQEEDRQRAAAAGFDHHLVKPVDPVALAKVLGKSNPRARVS